MRKAGFALVGCVALSACALKGDVRRVELQLAELREETARADSVRAVQLAQEVDGVISLQRQILDSLAALQRQSLLLAGQFRSEITEVQRQLLQIQELTGQSQQRLSDLNARIEQRANEPTPRVDSLQAPEARANETQARELYDVSIQQLRRGSPQTARDGFSMFLQEFSNHPLVPDALYNLGEAWSRIEADSAVAVWEEILERFPDSPRAPAALYKLGLHAEEQGRTDEARRYYQRLVVNYPNEGEAELARARLEDSP